ncbi:MAG: Spy0128 family protein [Ruminococcus sp.]
MLTAAAITFPIITYKESGTHYYQITEVKDEKPAYQYDESKYVVKVDVTDDNAGRVNSESYFCHKERRTCKE